jgi:fatty acid desaturase
MQTATPRPIEWPTLAMLVLTYAVWMAGTSVWQVSGGLALVLTILAIVQFASLQHEVLHGHPFAMQRLNEALVFPSLLLVVPYGRFRDTHLQHHHDPSLTDPYDDPESNYMDPAVWAKTPRPIQLLLRANNTLLGRIFLGPAVSTYYFVKADLAAALAGDRDIALAWALNAVGVALVAIWLWLVGDMPVLAYIAAAYMAYGVLKIRTFLEHRAHASHCARTVVVEDRGPLALLFLNNNLHVVHHMSPNTPWYQLPALYAAKRAHYLNRNDGYVYRNYAQIFRSHLLRAKDPVPHPVWPMTRDGSPDQG